MSGFDSPDLLGCRLTGCPGPAGGACINGLSFIDCPDVVRVEASPERGEASPSPESVKNWVETGGAGALDLAKCDRLLRRTGGVVVSVIGAPELGKTTLLSTIYELLHRRRLGTYAFAGSESLRGFEERCYLARVSANRSEADTPRTRVRDKSTEFLHLSVADGRTIHDIIFADRSGEDFETALASPGFAEAFFEIDRADVIWLLLDLKQLRDDRHMLISQSRRLFLLLRQHNLLPEKKFVIVGTKADLLSDEELRLIEAEIAETVSDWSALAPSLFSIHSTITASRARPGQTDFGSGIADLLGHALGAGVPPIIPNVDAVWPKRRNGFVDLMERYRWEMDHAKS